MHSSVHHSAVTASKAPERRPANRTQWIRLYTSLASLVLLTVSTSLYLNHQQTLMYESAVADNQQWARGIADLSALRQMASAVDQPGNDIFITGDVERESSKVRTALARFNDRRAQLSRTFAALPSAQRALLDTDLNTADAAMRRMAEGAERTFEAFRRGDTMGAAQNMAEMDRALSDVNAALGHAEQIVRENQTTQLLREGSEARTLRRTANGISALALLMFAGIMSYGLAMYRAMRRVAQERERFTAALQVSEAHTRAVVDSAGQGIFTCDEHGIIRTANSALCRFAGDPADGMVGQHISVLVPALKDVDPAQLQVRPAAEDAHGGPSQVWTAIAANGVERGVELSVTEVPVTHGRLFTVVMHDVTARAQLAQDLERARQTAEDASLAKSAFLANMSHELRTPLNAIIGYGEMLHEAAEERGDEETADDLARIHTAGKHLLSLINDILDLSKIEAGKTTLHIEDVGVRGLLSDVEMTAASLAKNSGNRLQFDVSPEVGVIAVDVVKLRQILLNLIGNACKFTSGGTVRTTADLVTEDSTTWFEVTVADSGIGMTPEQLDRLFKPFSQADASTTREYGGTGLGLVLSQRFAELLGGHISVTSTPGLGSQFTVRLPLRQVSGTVEVVDRGTPATTPSVHEGAYVLVVDDDPLAQDLIARQLAKMGIASQAAYSAAEALRIARGRTPLAITLDLLLPDQHGLSVLSTLKADPALANVPVVVVSITDDRGSGFALGASDYLVKPVDGAQLASTLARLLPSAQRPHVLVVDDDDDARAVLARRAAELGASIAQATNGMEALDAVGTQRPDLILLDLMMPVLDGFGVIEALRANPQTQTIPVVIVTARDMLDEDIRKLSGSVTALVQKQPTGRSSALDEIGRLLAAHTRHATPAQDPLAQAPTAASAARA